jgi:hypothetical protein
MTRPTMVTTGSRAAAAAGVQADTQPGDLEDEDIVIFFKGNRVAGHKEFKKDLLKNLLDNKDRVVVALQGNATNKSVIKSESKRKDLLRSLLEATPALDWVVRSRTTAEELGAKIYYVGKAAVAIFDAMDDSRDNYRVGPQLRLPVEQFLGRFKEMFETGKQIAVDTRNADVNKAFVSNILDQAEKQHKYCVGGFLPNDAALRTCVQCGHPYIDEPDTNIVRKAALDTMMKDYAILIEAYELHVSSGSSHDFFHKGKKLTRRPPPPKTPDELVVYLKCHCQEMFCTGSPNGQGSCGYCLENHPTPGEGCTKCVICKCLCSVAYKVSSMQIWTNF